MAESRSQSSSISRPAETSYESLNSSASDERLRVLASYWRDELLRSHPIYREFNKLAEQQTAAALLELIAARAKIRELSGVQL